MKWYFSFGDNGFESLSCCNETSLRSNCTALEKRSKIYGSLVRVVELFGLAELLQKLWYTQI